jgi:hypothetical protein
LGWQVRSTYAPRAAGPSHEAKTSISLRAEISNLFMTCILP